MTTPTVYTGVCYCKATKYSLALPTPLELTEECSCSFCRMTGILWADNLKHDAFKFEREGPITTYEFGKKVLGFDFCTTCGDQIRATGRADSSIELGINSRLLAELEPHSIPDQSDNNKGYSIGASYEFASYSGPPFDTSKPDEPITTGACHCGAVTIAIRGPQPANRTVIECNCNFCWRAARIHIYPEPADVHLSGEGNLSYTPAGKNLSAGFCKTCGCHMFSALDEPEADEETGLVPTLKRDELGHERFICAVNIRCLEGLDLGALKIRSFKGRERPPVFVVE